MKSPPGFRERVPWAGPVTRRAVTTNTARLEIQSGHNCQILAGKGGAGAPFQGTEVRLKRKGWRWQAAPEVALLAERCRFCPVPVRVNGRVRVVESADLQARGMVPQVHNPDGNSSLIQGLLLDIDEAYFHCPRSFQFADLWDADTIAANRARSLKDLMPAKA